MQKHRTPEEGYNLFAPIYDYIFGHRFDEGRRVAMEFLELKEGSKVLELGVGTGSTLLMYPPYCSMVGVDVSERMLARAQVIVDENSIKNISLRQMDAGKLDFPDNSFDGVWGNMFISVTDKPLDALKEMKRVCRPGGKLVLVNYFTSNNILLKVWEKAIGPLVNHLGWWRYYGWDADALLKEAELEANEVRHVNILNLWKAISIINPKD